MKYVYLLPLFFIFISCKNQNLFTAQERELIMSGAVDEPFRVLQITNYEDSLFLRKECIDVHNYENDKVFQHFIKRLECTLQTENGVGIAAPQVGIGRNVFLFMRLDLQNQPVTVVINPRITAIPDSTVCFERDGCLSIPDFSGNSARYPWIDVEYNNLQGEKITEKLSGYSRKDGFTGIIFQHEYDHTKGVLFIDKLCEL